MPEEYISDERCLRGEQVKDGETWPSTSDSGQTIMSNLWCFALVQFSDTRVLSVFMYYSTRSSQLNTRCIILSGGCMCSHLVPHCLAGTVWPFLKYNPHDNDILEHGVHVRRDRHMIWSAMRINGVNSPMFEKKNKLDTWKVLRKEMMGFFCVQIWALRAEWENIYQT